MLKHSINQKLFNFLKISLRQYKVMTSPKQGTPLQEIVTQLESFAPLTLAEKWDNVGLLIEPYIQRPIKTILLTNDLTLKVLAEAEAKNTDMIISYHPPIFAGLKRITQSNWKEKIVSACLAHGMALYSPHTAWDSVRNGVNDWLASALPNTQTSPIKPDPVGDYGPGRFVQLQSGITLGKAIESVQNHIGLNVHVAMGVNQSHESVVKTAAVCAGSGALLLKEVQADLYLTGEMSHHEVLDAQHRNISVILCNHSNSERGFLKSFQPVLDKMLQNRCDVILSESDKDPLSTVVKN